MFIPLQFQVAFVNFIAIFWNAYMSYMKNSNVDKTGHVVKLRIDEDDSDNLQENINTA